MLITTYYGPQIRRNIDSGLYDKKKVTNPGTTGNSVCFMFCIIMFSIKTESDYSFLYFFIYLNYVFHYSKFINIFPYKLGGPLLFYLFF